MSVKRFNSLITFHKSQSCILPNSNVNIQFNFLTVSMLKMDGREMCQDENVSSKREATSRHLFIKKNVYQYERLDLRNKEKGMAGK